MCTIYLCCQQFSIDHVSLISLELQSTSFFIETFSEHLWSNKKYNQRLQFIHLSDLDLSFCFFDTFNVDRVSNKKTDS